MKVLLPTLKKNSFNLQVPMLDQSTARRLRKVRGEEASKVEAREKALMASQFKILDIAKPLLYLWVSTTEANADPLLVTAAVSALQLWGHAFHSIMGQRRENDLQQTYPRFTALLN